jgi:hypothetical protein
MATPNLEIGSKVVQDAVAAFKAQPTVPSAIGAATREIVTGPVSYGMEKLSNMAQPLASAGGEFLRGLSGGTPSGAAGPNAGPATPSARARGTITPAPAFDSPEARSRVVAEIAASRPAENAPMAPLTVDYGDPAMGMQRGPIASSSTMGADGVRSVSIRDGSSQADTIQARPPSDPNVSWVLDSASGQVRQMGNVMLAARGGEAAARARDPRYQAARAAYDAGTSTPSLEPISRDPKDPAEAYLEKRNKGDWSNMTAALKYANLLAGNRTANLDARKMKMRANVDEANAEIERLIAESRMKTAAAGARQSDAAAAESMARVQESQGRQSAQALDLAEREEFANIRRLAAAGDQKALARYRQLSAARQGKDPEGAANEKLLEAYIRSTGEWGKDPANIGRPAPTFQEFLGGLPPQMFPHVAQFLGAPAPLPSGAVRKIGTSNGRPVYLMRDGSQMVATQ